MKLRAAALRAMTLLPKERKRTTIVRQSEPATLYRAAPKRRPVLGPVVPPLNSHRDGAVCFLSVQRPIRFRHTILNRPLMLTIR
jgi:hypothetical protein